MECAAIFPKFGISIYSALWYLCVYTVVLKKSEKIAHHNFFLPLEANNIDNFSTKKDLSN